MSPLRPVWTRWFFLSAFLLVGCLCSRAQLPAARLSTLFPPGGTAGSTFEVSVSGPDLDHLKELRFSHAGIAARPKSNEHGTPIPNRFVVRIDPEVPPGLYEARAFGQFGLSNPRAFQVGTLPELQERAPHDSMSAAMDLPLDTVVNARAEANAFDFYRFSATPGQRVFISCADAEIDSRADIVLVLYDRSGRELDRSRYGRSLDFTAREEGPYYLKLHDFLYRGGEEYFYRLSASIQPRIDFVLPGAGPSGQTSKQVVYGRNLPGGTRSPFEIDGKPLDQLEIEIPFPSAPRTTADWPGRILSNPASLALDGWNFRITGATGVSSPAFLTFANEPVLMEGASNDQPETADRVAPPCLVAGQFFPRLDRDWIEFTAEKGESYWIEIYSQRLGSPTHPFLLVQRVMTAAQGEKKVSEIKELYDSESNAGGREFNTASRDPAWKFEVKESGAYRLQVRDLFNRSEDDPSRVYRLVIRPVKPSFRLAALIQPPPQWDKNRREAVTWPAHLRRGETTALKIVALRQDGFNGEIRVRARELPAGVACTEARIESGQTSALLYLTASEEAADWKGPLQILGTANEGETKIEELAAGSLVVWTVNDYNNEPVWSRITHDLQLSVSGQETAPITFGSVRDKAWEAAEGSKIEIPIEVTRRGEFKEAIKLRAAGIAALDSIPEFEIAGNTNQTVLQIDLSKQKLPVGMHHFYLAAQTKGKYRRQTLEEVQRAEAEIKTAEEELKKAEEQAASLSEAAQQTEAAKSALARKEAAAQRVKTAKEALQRMELKELTITAYSQPITLKVVESKPGG